MVIASSASSPVLTLLQQFNHPTSFSSSVISNAALSAPARAHSFTASPTSTSVHLRPRSELTSYFINQRSKSFAGFTDQVHQNLIAAFEEQSGHKYFNNSDHSSFSALDLLSVKRHSIGDSSNNSVALDTSPMGKNIPNKSSRFFLSPKASNSSDIHSSTSSLANNANNGNNVSNTPVVFNNAKAEDDKSSACSDRRPALLTHIASAFNNGTASIKHAYSYPIATRKSSNNNLAKSRAQSSTNAVPSSNTLEFAGHPQTDNLAAATRIVETSQSLPCTPLISTREENILIPAEIPVISAPAQGATKPLSKTRGAFEFINTLKKKKSSSFFKKEVKVEDSANRGRTSREDAISVNPAIETTGLPLRSVTDETPSVLATVPARPPRSSSRTPSSSSIPMLAEIPADVTTEQASGKKTEDNMLGSNNSLNSLESNSEPPIIPPRRSPLITPTADLGVSSQELVMQNKAVSWDIKQDIFLGSTLFKSDIESPVVDFPKFESTAALPISLDSSDSVTTSANDCPAYPTIVAPTPSSSLNSLRTSHKKTSPSMKHKHLSGPLLHHARAASIADKVPTPSGLTLDLRGLQKPNGIVSQTSPSSPLASARPSTPMVRKKSGELVKSSMKHAYVADAAFAPPVPSLPVKKDTEITRPSFAAMGSWSSKSAPATPGIQKYVHFGETCVKLFREEQKPAAVSRPGSPQQEFTESESEPPVPYMRGGKSSANGQQMLELVLPNFPQHTNSTGDQECFLENIMLVEEGAMLRGVVQVKNIAFHKWVAVRFTCDLWSTTSEVTASHRDTIKNGQYDRFTFSIKLSEMTNLEQKTMYMAVRFNVEGKEVWDSNNGANYELKFRRSSERKSNHDSKDIAGACWSDQKGSGDRMADLKRSFQALSSEDMDGSSPPQLRATASMLANHNQSHIPNSSPTKKPQFLMDEPACTMPTESLKTRYDFGQSYKSGSPRKSPQFLTVADHTYDSIAYNTIGSPGHSGMIALAKLPNMNPTSSATYQTLKNNQFYQQTGGRCSPGAEAWPSSFPSMTCSPTITSTGSFSSFDANYSSMIQRNLNSHGRQLQEELTPPTSFGGDSPSSRADSLPPTPLNAGDTFPPLLTFEGRPGIDSSAYNAIIDQFCFFEGGKPLLNSGMRKDLCSKRTYSAADIPSAATLTSVSTTPVLSRHSSFEKDSYVHPILAFDGATPTCANMTDGYFAHENSNSSYQNL